MITSFDTTSESFLVMRGPVIQKSRTYLYEADGTLGIYSCNDSMTTVDIWVMQDYDNKVWSHKYHVKLPVTDFMEYENRDVMVVHEERGVFVLYSCGQTLFLVDTEGKLMASSHLDACINLTAMCWIKESLVQHSFFSALQGALNVWSFI